MEIRITGMDALIVNKIKVTNALINYFRHHIVISAKIIVIDVILLIIQLCAINAMMVIFWNKTNA